MVRDPGPQPLVGLAPLRNRWGLLPPVLCLALGFYEYSASGPEYDMAALWLMFGAAAAVLCGALFGIGRSWNLIVRAVRQRR